jgi:CII-binding regulator of phage lambda lysogenization HflD
VHAAHDLDDELMNLRRELQRLSGVLPEHVDVDPDRVAQDLAKLVLSLIEFLRQLLERQAIRRMEGGTLSEEEIERMGLALMRLEEKLHELARHFDLQPGDLNLNLGPLGKLV